MRGWQCRQCEGRAWQAGRVHSLDCNALFALLQCCALQEQVLPEPPVLQGGAAPCCSTGASDFP